MAKKKSPAALPAAITASAPVVPSEAMTAAGKLSVATHQGLDAVRRLLEPVIDVQRFADDVWLSDPENRKIAAVQLKFLAQQKEVALGVISSQLRRDKMAFGREEEERRRREVLEQLQRDFGVPTRTS
jgi:hypothetical protein